MTQIAMSDSGNDSIELAGPGEPASSDSGDFEMSRSETDRQVAVFSSSGAELGSFQVHQPPSPRDGEQDPPLADRNVLESELEAWGAHYNLSYETMTVLRSSGYKRLEDVRLHLDEIMSMDITQEVKEELLAAVKHPGPHRHIVPPLDLGQEVPSPIGDPELDSNSPLAAPDIETNNSDSESDSDQHMIDILGKQHNLDYDVLDLLKRLGYFTLDRVAALSQKDLENVGLDSDQIAQVLGAIKSYRNKCASSPVELQTSGVEIAESYARFGLNASSLMKESNMVFGRTLEGEETALDFHLDAWATLHNLDKYLLSVLVRLGYTDLKTVSKVTQQDLDRIGIPDLYGEKLLEAIGCLQHEGPCPHIAEAVVNADLNEVKKDRPKSRYGKGQTVPDPNQDTVDEGPDSEVKDMKEALPEDNIITFTEEGNANILRRFQGSSTARRKEMGESSMTEMEEFAQAQILEVLHGLATNPGQLHKAPEIATKDSVLETAGKEQESDPFVRNVSRMLDETELSMKALPVQSTSAENLDRPATAVGMNPLLLHNFSSVPDDMDSAAVVQPTAPPSSPRATSKPQEGHAKSRGNTPPDSRMTDVDNSEEDFDTGQPDMMAAMPMGPPGQGQGPPRPAGLGGPERGGALPLEQKQKKHQQQFMDDEEDDDEDGSESEDDDEDDDDEDEDDDAGVALEGAYDPADYDHLPVVPEIKELFQYITRYTPQAIELEHKLKPFIPDFIPAVGDIDAFIKITRPDNKPDDIGLKVLDEPCAKQSDPTVLDLHLRSISKQTNLKAVSIKSVENAERNPKAIDSWIESITELHRSKPPPNVHYTKNMPDIDTLMQEWPPEFEELLKEVGLPTAEIDCDLGTYVDMICGILDIPVHKSKIQSLHVLFTLYSEFKNSQHFKSLAEGNQLDNVMKNNDFMSGGANEDRLIL